MIVQSRRSKEENGTLPADKSLEEVQEVKYHQKAWDFVVSQYQSKEIDGAIIREIHRKVLYYDEDMLPGEYRKVNIIIRDAKTSCVNFLCFTHSCMWVGMKKTKEDRFACL